VPARTPAIGALAAEGEPVTDEVVLLLIAAPAVGAVVSVEVPSAAMPVAAMEVRLSLPVLFV
jgi:hypothetical protein